MRGHLTSAHGVTDNFLVVMILLNMYLEASSVFEHGRLWLVISLGLKKKKKTQKHKKSIHHMENCPHWLLLFCEESACGSAACGYCWCLNVVLFLWHILARRPI